MKQRLSKLVWILALLVVSLAPASAAPQDVCVERDNWYVCYQTTATDGLKVYYARYRGLSVLAVGTLPQINVRYAGFTFRDELGYNGIQPTGAIQVLGLSDGFEVQQTYAEPDWPSCSTYRYTQRWRFRQDGRLEPGVITYGPGTEGGHTYDVYYRLDLDVNGSVNSFNQWQSGGWSQIPYEGNYPAGGNVAPSGAKWRVHNGSQAYDMIPGGEDSANMWALANHVEQGGTDLPNQSASNFPQQWVNGESLQQTDVVLWYQAHNYKATNCDQTTNLVSGPTLLAIGFTGEMPTPTATGTSVVPSTTAAVPTATNTATQTPRPSPTTTATPTGQQISGFAGLQGRANRTGVHVWLDQAQMVTTGNDGLFRFSNVATGAHTIKAEFSGFLCSQQTVHLNGGQVVDIGSTILRAGDATQDDQVNLLDFVLIASHYGEKPITDPRADINGDGAVDLIDLVLAAGNYGLACPLPWSGLSAPAGSPASTDNEKTLRAVEGIPFRVQRVSIEGDQAVYAVMAMPGYTLRGVELHLTIAAGATVQPGAAFANPDIGLVVRNQQSNGTLEFIAVKFGNPASQVPLARIQSGEVVRITQARSEPPPQIESAIGY
ncbi:MAG: hypothetical protein EXR62_06750 [Chloroflexi bacterium]|nr:hypothetical protein [Chloroflexota bacterium]